MKNQLFNKTLLKKHSKSFKLNVRKHDLLKEYISKVKSGHFKSETKNYLYFYDVILKDVLGYKREDVLFDEGVDSGTGRSEFVLKSNEKKFMVIELKGQGIDLDKRQSGRSDNKSPVEQAFGYALNTGDVDWIMVSNYEEFRLYNYYEKTRFISFNVEELLDKKKFAYFMVSFSKESHIESDYINKVKEDTLVVDRKLASEFYKLYNETRLMLIKELEVESSLDRLDAIHYAQLILNRYMFICFAEDTNLLPSQISVDTISTPILKGNIRHRSIWQRLNELCLDINEGNQFKKISEYNGGLFCEDLDFIKIRDLVEDQTIFKDVYQKWNFTEYEKDISHLLGNSGHLINPIYRNMLTISSFDFSTELDVNILGHIFENSIGDIEELKEGSKGRRKKEGIFYTPDYITDYICRNTIIPYLSESGTINTVDELLGEYWGSKIEELDWKVKNIKIVDPACGSGAFLNKAADILVKIHQRIHETRYKDEKETLKPYFDNIGQRREILLHNIYGVDLNEESTDITKLSLFLKVCRKGLKLPNLDDNIKCGNSLIDDQEYTDKPFKWEEEFPEIFQTGGFDVVIGNPPYVRVQNLPYDEIDYYKQNYECAYKRVDISILFIELANKILKNKGLNSFITSNQFLTTEYGRKARRYILEKCDIREIVDYGDLPVFPDAITYVSIFTFGKGKTSNFEYYKVPSLKEDLDKIDSIKINPSNLGDDVWILKDNAFLGIISKLNKHPALKEGIGKCWVGIITGNDKVFIFDAEDIDDVGIEKELLLPLMRAQDCNRYGYSTFSKYVIYPYKDLNGKTVLISELEIKDKYPKLYNYLIKHKNDLMKRKDSRKTLSDKSDWYKLTRFGRFDIFNQEKIIFPGETKRNKFGFDVNKAGYSGARVFSVTSENPEISIKYLLGIFNSILIEKYLHSTTSLKKGGYYSYSATYIDKIPIPKIDLKAQKPFIEKTNKMLKLNQDIQEEMNGFKHWIQKEFEVEKLSQKLEKYYELSEEEFIDELRKKKVNTKSRKNREDLEREFNDSLTIINPLLQEIELTDNEINQMVYELYALTDDEIQIIETSYKRGG